jgi:hypothetical protein
MLLSTLAVNRKQIGAILPETADYSVAVVEAVLLQRKREL